MIMPNEKRLVMHVCTNRQILDGTRTSIDSTLFVTASFTIHHPSHVIFHALTLSRVTIDTCTGALLGAPKLPAQQMGARSNPTPILRLPISNVVGILFRIPHPL